MSPRYRLIQCRDIGDPVAVEEIGVFARQLGVPVGHIQPHDALTAPMSLAAVTQGVDAVLVGGSGRYSIIDDAPWISSFIDVLGELVAADAPTFASCFGFQGIVVALGGEVQPAPGCAEVGSFAVERTEDADPLLEGLPASFLAQMGHKDAAVRFPEGATHLLRSARCTYQALRTGKNVYATQFHPELTVNDNQARFRRYEVEYSKAFGPAEAAAVAHAFRPSPEASELLPRFAKVVLGA